MSQSEQGSGFLLIDKPVGPTSHDIVARVRRAMPKGTKVGHAGTLDPLASGLLIIGIGKATKELSKLVGLDKTYVCTVRLGATSVTDDGEGPITENTNTDPPVRDVVELTVKKFIGEQEQIPPAFSAKKVEGQRLYKIARRGESVAPKPQHVTIHALEIISYHYPELEIRISCASGTYIRALARDIGRDLKTGGYVSALRRTKIGPFNIQEATAATTIMKPIASDKILARLAVDD